MTNRLCENRKVPRGALEIWRALHYQRGVHPLSQYTHFQDLKRQLTDLRDSNVQATNLDVLHGENVKAGRDKYKTLKQIRSGNTKSRVDQFEML